MVVSCDEFLMLSNVDEMRTVKNLESLLGGKMKEPSQKLEKTLLKIHYIE